MIKHGDSSKTDGWRVKERNVCNQRSQGTNRETSPPVNMTASLVWDNLLYSIDCARGACLWPPWWTVLRKQLVSRYITVWMPQVSTRQQVGWFQSYSPVLVSRQWKNFSLTRNLEFSIFSSLVAMFVLVSGLSCLWASDNTAFKMPLAAYEMQISQVKWSQQVDFDLAKWLPILSIQNAVQSQDYPKYSAGRQVNDIPHLKVKFFPRQTIHQA